RVIDSAHTAQFYGNVTSEVVHSAEIRRVSLCAVHSGRNVDHDDDVTAPTRCGRPMRSRGAEDSGGPNADDHVLPRPRPGRWTRQATARPPRGRHPTPGTAPGPAAAR